jgi:outer membrane protein
VLPLAVLLASAGGAAFSSKALASDGDGPSSAAQSRTLTLSQAEETALRNQPTLRQAHAQTDAAQGRVEQARSGYLPQATFTGIYQRASFQTQPRPGFLPSNATTVLNTSWPTATQNYFNLGVTASQLIYDFGQTSDRWRAAAASRDATQLTELTTEEQALLNVRSAYFLARADEDLITVARETLGNQEKHLNQIQAFVGAGIRPEIDLAQARTAVSNARVQLVTAVNNQAVASAQLEQAMGVTERVKYDLADSALAPVAGEDGALEKLVDNALAIRPELATLQRQRRAQELTIAALRGGFGPSLNATASASEAGVEVDRLVPDWSVGLSLVWPFLQGGLTKGQVHEANANLAALVAQEDALRLTVGVQVEQAQLAVRAAKETISASRDALVNARDQLRLAEARYAQGLGSVIELGDSQVAVTAAAAQDVQARFNLSAARAQLMSALGVR